MAMMTIPKNGQTKTSHGACSANIKKMGTNNPNASTIPKQPLAITGPKFVKEMGPERFGSPETRRLGPVELPPAKS